MGKLTNIVLAAVAGFVAGIIWAPKSGRETRDDLKKHAKKAEEVARRKADELGKVVRESASVAGEEAVEFGHSAKDTAEKIAAEAAALGGEARVRTRRVITDTGRSIHGVSVEKTATKSNAKPKTDQ